MILSAQVVTDRLGVTSMEFDTEDVKHVRDGGSGCTTLELRNSSVFRVNEQVDLFSDRLQKAWRADRERKALEDGTGKFFSATFGLNKMLVHATHVVMLEREQDGRCLLHLSNRPDPIYVKESYEVMLGRVQR